MQQQSDLLKDIVGMSCRLRILQDKTTGDTAKFIRYAISALNSAESVITHFADFVPAAPDNGIKYDNAKPRYDLIPRELYKVPWADIKDDYYHGLIRFWHHRNMCLYRILCMTRTAVEKAGWDYLAALATVYAYGAGIYGDRNWEKGMAWGRLYNAAMRHYAARKSGEELDPESGLPHLWHEAWNVATLYVYELRRGGTDDRPYARRYEEGEGHD